MQAALTGLADRRLADVLAGRLAEEPVIVLNGPRTVGKSTLLAHLATRLGIHAYTRDGWLTIQPLDRLWT